MKRFYFLVGIVLFAFSPKSFSQISLTGTSYSQDFNSLVGTGVNITWTNNSTIAGWYSTRATYNANNGASTTGTLYSYGTGTNVDRALGSVASGGTGTIYYGALFKNNSASVITNIQITYRGEQWRNGGNTTPQPIKFYYQTGTSLTSLTAGTWTASSSLDFTGPVASASAAALDGNAAANFASISASIPAISLAPGDELMIRWEDLNDSGNDHGLSVDDFTISYSGGGADVTPPTIASLSPSNGATGVAASGTASITFSENVQKGTGNVIVKRTSDNVAVQTIDVTTAAVTVTGSSASFTLSGLSTNTGYYIEIDNGAFQDLSANIFTGISGSATWGFTTSNIINTVFTANYNTCATGTPGTITDGFTRYSVTGTQVWDCTTFGRSGNGMQINGYDNALPSNVPNVDWLISPAFDLTSTAYPLLSFWSRTKFNGGPLQLKVSTNYSGSGDPALAAWTDLNGKFPNQTSDVWTQSANINLFAFKQAAVYIAFVYTSTNEEGARWTLDDLQIDNSATAPPASITVSTTDVQYTYVASGSTADKTFSFTGNDITTDVTITATGAFQLSKDGTAFSSSINYTLAEANNISKTVFIRFAPTQVNQSYNSTATISTSSLNSVINLTGTSIDPAITLEIVNWNIEWFGDAGNGPADNNLQEQNVKIILENTGADIFGLTEIVSESRLANVVSQMPGYTYVIGNFGSHVNPPEPAGGSIADAQKLAFVYKTSVFSNVSARPLINNQNTGSTSYNNWSSGRYPFLMTADVTLDGQTKTIHFILIHGKANTSPTATSYARRQAAATELHDTLTTYFPSANVVVLGDFNDDLDQSITDGFTTTSYSAFTTDNANFFSPTLALSLAGKKSTVSYNDVIDHVIVSNEMEQLFMNATANILTDVSGLVSNYASTTSDHYPVFSRFAFDAGVLPVKLITFNAAKSGNNVKLTWTTSEEVNAKEFVIERSANGRNYQNIGKVIAAGNTNSSTAYQFTDVSPNAGNNFYRLRIVDQDQKSELSRVLRIDFNKAYTFSLSPNPAKSQFTVTVTNASEPLLLQIIDVSGKVVKTQIITNQLNKVQVGNLSKGFYLVKMKSSNATYTEKLIIE